MTRENRIEPIPRAVGESNFRIINFICNATASLLDKYLERQQDIPQSISVEFDTENLKNNSLQTS